VREVLDVLASPQLTAMGFVGLLCAALLRAAGSEHRAFRMQCAAIAIASAIWLLLAGLGIWGPDLARWSPVALLFLALLDDDRPGAELPGGQRKDGRPTVEDDQAWMIAMGRENARIEPGAVEAGPPPR
jgi:hypothetical protein